MSQIKKRFFQNHKKKAKQQWMREKKNMPKSAHEHSFKPSCLNHVFINRLRRKKEIKLILLHSYFEHLLKLCISWRPLAQSNSNQSAQFAFLIQLKSSRLTFSMITMSSSSSLTQSFSLMISFIIAFDSSLLFLF